MKKSIITACIGLGAASFLMLSGFDSAATVDDVLTKYQEAGNSAESFSATEVTDATVTIAVPSQNASMGIMLDMNMDIDFIKNPLQMGFTADIAMSVLGENQNIKLDMYMVQEDDGTFGVYSKTDDGSGTAQWAHQTVDKAQADEIINLMNSNEMAKVDYAALGINWNMDPQPTTVGASTCYHLTCDLTWDDIMQIVKNAGEMAGQAEAMNEAVAELEAMSEYLSGIKASIALDIDDTTYLPAQMVLDLNGTDWTQISSLAGAAFGTDDQGNPIEVELSAEGLAITATYDYTSPVSIEVPEEALQTPVSGDLQEGLGDVVGELAG